MNINMVAAEEPEKGEEFEDRQPHPHTLSTEDLSCFPSAWRRTHRLTNEAKNVPDGWHENDEEVVEDQDGHCYQYMPNPAELSPVEQQRYDRGSNLRHKA